jgi:hypothetical protein
MFAVGLLSNLLSKNTVELALNTTHAVLQIRVHLQGVHLEQTLHPTERKEGLS